MPVLDIDKISALTAKIKTPLALSGFVFAVLYGIYRQVLSLNVFSNIGSSSTFQLLQDVLGKLFWLALVALILGVASYIAVPILNHRIQRKSSRVALLDASLVAGDEVGNPWGVSSEPWRFVFPKVDFKFQNTGSATALVGRYAILVLAADIDPTPVLSFYYKVTNRGLQISSSNRGWGAANRCEVVLKSDVLGSLYSAEEMRTCSNVPDGDNLFNPVLELPSKDLSEDAFNRIKERQAANTNLSGGYHQRDSVGDAELEDAVPVGDLWVDWNCIDNSGRLHQGSCVVYGLGHNALLLTRTGFRGRAPTSSGCGTALACDTEYRSLIDPTRGPHERVYTISRQIPPGDLERFRIEVGAPRSCRLHLNFKFFIDESDVIESKPFQIHVWNPRNSPWEYDYRDGQEVAVSENELNPSRLTPKFRGDGPTHG